MKKIMILAMSIVCIIILGSILGLNYNELNNNLGEYALHIINKKNVKEYTSKMPKGLEDSIMFVKHSNGLCFAWTTSFIYGQAVQSITEVDCKKVGLE